MRGQRGALTACFFWQKTCHGVELFFWARPCGDAGVLGTWANVFQKRKTDPFGMTTKKRTKQRKSKEQTKAKAMDQLFRNGPVVQ
jgi:hypothetical protein